MKKTLSLLMGALLAAMLPVGNVKAQVKTVQVEVLTLDNAALTSAVIYGDTVSGRTYFVDSALLADGYTGDLVLVDTLPYIDTLTVNGTTASGSVDSANFGRSLIVFRDVNGKTYVLGNVSNRMDGVFQASNLFVGTTTGLDLTGVSAVGAANTMLSELPMITYRNGFYSAFKYATVNAIAGDTISINHTSPAGLLDTVYAPVVLNFAGDTVNGALHLAHTTGTLTVMGGRLNMITGSNDEAAVVLKAIDSLGSFNPGLHATSIESGNYSLISASSSSTILISGGCFGADYSAYRANRFYFAANTGLNAASFPYTVLPGYAVTWHNWDYALNDTTIYYDQPDNMIRPVLASPFPATCDTVINGRFTDPSFEDSTSWNFLTDVLTQDTNIYVRWTAPTPGTVRMRFVHNLLDAYNNVETSDTVVYYDSIGHSRAEYIRTYPNYFCNNHIGTVIIPFTGNDTIVDFNYERNAFLLTWNLNGGSFTDGFAESDSLRWGTAIDYTHTPVLEGHNFTGWLPAMYVNMPTFDLTVNAQYDIRLYGLTWNGVGGTTPYTGSAIDNVSATFTDDNGNTVDAILTFQDANGNYSSTITAVGSYSVFASSPNPNYHFNADTVRTVVVVPATLTVTGTTAEMVKVYDGTRDAVITNPGTLNTVYGSDDVQLTTTALFTDQYPGEGKTILAHYTISGANASSYVLDTAYAIVGASNSATILAPITPNTLYGNGGGYNNSYDPAYAGFNGYCTDTAIINYRLAKVNGVAAVVDQYTLFFDANAKNEGFADVNTYVNTVDDTTIMFLIPDTAKAGDYSAKLVLLNSAYPQFIGDTININFTVGMNKDYVTAIFGNVLTIVNKDEMLNYDQYNWFCNGVEMGQYGQYYNDPNGLSSSNYYYVQLTNSTSGATVRTCPQSFVDVVAEDSVFLSTYPNPTTSKANVQVTNGKASHTLRVMNVMGQVVFTTKFDGENYSLDLDGYANGTYTVTVDGATVRIIKK